MSQQNSSQPYESQRSGSSSGSSQPPPRTDPYDDPTNLLRVYPFLTYQPTARVAQHLAPHITTYPTPSSSSDLYPQYADAFGRIDRPQTAQDWQMRNDAELRLRDALQRNAGQSYISHQPYPSPGEPMSFPTLTSQPLPLPYTFLPSYMPSPSFSSHHQPPTPSSLASPNTPSSSNEDPQAFFDSFVQTTLQRSQAPPPPPAFNQRQSAPLHATPQQPSRPSPAPTIDPSVLHSRQRQSSVVSSVTSTPTIARQLARTALTPGESPDPLSFTDGPSPSKRPRPSRSASSEGYDKTSPTLKGSQRLPHSDEEMMLTPKGGQGAVGKGKKPVVEVVIPMRRKSGDEGKQQEELDEDEEEDELDWGDAAGEMDGDGDWTMDGEMRSPGVVASAGVARGSGRTGERDTRNHQQKLQALLEDVIEEQDSLPAIPSASDLVSARFFTLIDKSGEYALLSPQAVEKIGRYVARLQKSRRRQSSLGTHDSNGCVEWDVEAWSRVLRLLERVMREAEGVVVFKSDGDASLDSTKHPGGTKSKKGKQGKKESKSPERGHSGGEVQDGEVSAEGGLSEIELSKCDDALEKIRCAVGAAEAVLVIFDTDGLSKQLLSEDLLSTAVGIIKEALTGVLVPLLEGIAGGKVSSAYLAQLLASTIALGPKKLATSPLTSNPVIASIAQSLSSALPRLTSLLDRHDLTLSDSLVIQTVYLAVAPLFLGESAPTTIGRKKTAKTISAGYGLMRGIRIEALGCLRAAFARYEEQRQWIIEEILGSLVKLSDQVSVQSRFQLSNGNSIFTVSALLLQLIQASTYGVPAKICKLRAQALEVGDEKAEKVDIFEDEGRICGEAIEGALRSARAVVGYLVQKSVSIRGSKTSHDAEYKAILDSFVADLLSVLYRPEWPAASLFLGVMSRIMMSALDDVRTTAEAQAQKVLALDYLGDIAAKLRGVTLEVSGEKGIPTPDDVISRADSEATKQLVEAYKVVQNHLSSAAREDSMYAGSLDMESVIVAQDLQAAIKKAGSIIDKLAVEKEEEATETRENLQIVAQQLRSALKGVWTGDEGLFEPVSVVNQGELAASAALALSQSRPLHAAFDPILHALVATMNTPTVAFRSKSLRALASIITVDPEILSFPAVRAAIEDRLSDTSPQVRDAAVELVGKYVLQKPALIGSYYPHIAARIGDTGLGVRKRVIKLLKGIFMLVKERDVKVDICCRIVTLVGDRDESVKELAQKTLAEMIYPAESGDAAALLVDLVSEYRGRQATLELAIQELNAENTSSGHPERFRQTIDALTQRLIDATERSDFDALSHIRAIWLLCAGQPDLIDTGKAAVLLTHLRHPPANSDEQAANEVLLRIFKHCIPSMPKAASTFAKDLTEALMPMINRPTGGFSAIKETVGCFCAVTNHLTKDYSSLLRILRACESRCRQMLKAFLSDPAAAAKAYPTRIVSIMLFITALIAEHCNLDKLAQSDSMIEDELDKIAKHSLSEHLFDLYLAFSKISAAQTAPSICLGSLFRTYPSLINRPEAVDWMDGVFQSNDFDNQARLLGVLHDFMTSETAKKAASNGTPVTAKGRKKKDMDALIGSTTDLSDSAVSTSVLQRHFAHVLEGARSQHAVTQNAALDVLAFTINQGLHHPLQSLPVLISLETSADGMIAERAFELHTILHGKHPTLVNMRWLEMARESFDYQRRSTSEVSGHRQGQALLGAWYSLIAEKRPWRIEFLKAMVRAFDHDMATSSQLDMDFALYIADNLATLEYKLQDEVMTVVQQLGILISGCSQLAATLESAQIDGEEADMLDGRRARLGEASEDEGEEAISAGSLINASMIAGLALLLKNHLLDLYGVAEDKCLKHQPGKKSAAGDKPAVKRREDGVLDTSRLAHVRGIVTVGEFREQQAAFLQLLHDDGTLGEAEA